MIACNTRATKSPSGDQPAYSYIYKMKYDEIVLFQKLETRTAFGVDTIEIGKTSEKAIKEYVWLLSRLGFNFYLWIHSNIHVSLQLPFIITQFHPK